METAAMKAAATVEPAASVKPLSSVEVTAAVEVAATIAAIESMSIPAAAVVAISPTVVTATILAAPVAVRMIAVVTVIPRSGADEDAAGEPIRSVIAVGGARVRIIVVIAIGADGSRLVIRWTSNTDATSYALGV